jgi:inorganic pyrophosphatase
MQIEVIVEIPKGTRNKYEADEAGRIWLDRMLFTATRYPEDYGYVPGTLAEDGDPMDALVILEEPTFPGCHIHARPVGVFLMRDEEGVDAKLLCVPASDPRWNHVQELADLPEFELREIAHFFDIYKDLEPGKGTEPGGWSDRPAAEAAIEGARERYRTRSKDDGGAVGV